MNQNSKHRFLAWLLAFAFTLPIVIKAEHLMFPNHEHHGYSCQHTDSDIKDVCGILEFDYFFFVASDIICITPVVAIELKSYLFTYYQANSFDYEFGYSHRAPPYAVNLFV
ncbi:hypothetical protein [Ancylomarina subtilis]|nr:hypothetical protein [Ancylomarina subtilis]